MTRREWIKCVKLARSENFQSLPYLELTAFRGMALDNSRRAATVEEVASLLVGHCATFGGTWLHQEEREIESLYPRIDLV